ncbi:elongation factor G [Desulfovibrio sp. TomC]|uniref:elongation factor G n=1 Tax=Desulfovibrio sp. TomC TaxID=1562888 RepID=UPI0005743044|nr:elongation factor G [Desulfovibrio sp. TomC]KHK04251.1 Translation elongation factor G-related protein [Desulfovibrio sp. TomC]
MSAKKGTKKSRLASLRNIGIIAHIDAGKTTLTERILFFSGRIHRMGEVHDGTATMDFMPEEQERGITITSACTTCSWKDHQINIIDTPGHVDFTIEVERSLRVLDGAVGVFCAVAGVEPQSETVWRQSVDYGVPKLAVVNKLDRPGADFEAVLAAMREKLRANPVAVSIPVAQGPELAGLIDLVTLERLDFEPGGGDMTRRPLSAAETELAGPWREKLVEAACDYDETVLEAYLSGHPIAPGLLVGALRTGTIAHGLVPVLAASALKNVGIQPILDGVLAYLPSPLDREGAVGVDPETKAAVAFPPDVSAPLAALVFKVSMETGRRQVFARVYSGRIEAGKDVYNATRGEIERPARLFHLHAGHREKAEIADPGEIVAIAGMRHAATGDTLCARETPILLETIAGYKPVISLALEPRNAEETERLGEVLAKLTEEDPTLTLTHDPDTGQMILSGMGELHLDVVLERARREYGVSPRAGKPQVVYQETVTIEAAGEGEFERELGERLHHGRVTLAVSPLPREAGRDIVFEIDRQTYPPTWSAAMAEGLEDGLQSGPLSGHPVQDVRVRVTGIFPVEGKTTDVGCRMAASQALKAALSAARPALLEPIMELEVGVPDAFIGDAIGLLGSKGAKIENMVDRGGHKTVTALAPLRQMFGFSTELRSATQGRAGMTMRFLKFDLLQ